jgi:rubrerythrin
MKAEQVHAGNYDDVLTNLDDEDYINSEYAAVFRCPVCGEVVTERPDRCPICNAAGTSFAIYNGTYSNLYASVQGETNASAAYTAFAAKADEEGYPVIAQLFIATADAEAKHAADEWAILQSMGATERPVAAVPTVGTTAENLQAAFDGETYEYTVMYPDFKATADAEGMTDASRIFNLAMKAEQVHAGNYDDVLKNLDDEDYINSEYEVVYRCPVCGEVVTERPDRCPICNAAGTSLIMYKGGTGIGNIQIGKTLSAYVQNGILQIKGLTTGNTWSIYSISGQLVHQSIAGSDHANISLRTRGVYIVKSGNKTLKVVF